MQIVIRLSIGVLLASSFATAQDPADTSRDAIVQALLKEVHALRIAMEHGTQIGPRIQIALARIQMQEERVRNATRQLQDVRDKLAEVQTRKTDLTDQTKHIEALLALLTDPNTRK